MKAAVSRLEFGPKPQAMEVTDIATGHFVFAPVEGRGVSYELLDRAVTDAGYEIEDASISVSGRLSENRHLETPEGIVYHLKATDESVKIRLLELDPDTRIEVEGAWTVEKETELIVVTTLRAPDREESGKEIGEESGAMAPEETP